MKKHLILAAAALMATSSVSAAFAQTATTDTGVAGHPRVNEIDQRLENQQKRIDSGVQNGTINAKQEARDEKTDAKVADQLSKDEAKHDGHITKAEQRRMNKELNHNSARIHRQKTKAATPAPAAQ